jgi:hypothetical protein
MSTVVFLVVTLCGQEDGYNHQSIIIDGSDITAEKDTINIVTVLRNVICHLFNDAFLSNLE